MSLVRSGFSSDELVWVIMKLLFAHPSEADNAQRFAQVGFGPTSDIGAAWKFYDGLTQQVAEMTRLLHQVINDPRLGSRPRCHERHVPQTQAARHRTPVD